MVAHFPFIEDQEKPLRDLLNAHPEWSEATAVAESRKRGLKFAKGDDQALLKALPLKEIATIYAPLRVTKITFLFVKDKREWGERADNTLLWWEVMLKEIATKRSLQLMVDPFNGRIFSVSEHDPEWEK